MKKCSNFVVIYTYNLINTTVLCSKLSYGFPSARKFLWL